MGGVWGRNLGSQREEVVIGGGHNLWVREEKKLYYGDRERAKMECNNQTKGKERATPKGEAKGTTDQKRVPQGKSNQRENGGEV